MKKITLLILLCMLVSTVAAQEHYLITDSNPSSSDNEVIQLIDIELASYSFKHIPVDNLNRDMLSDKTSLYEHEGSLLVIVDAGEWYSQDSTYDIDSKKLMIIDVADDEQRCGVSISGETQWIDISETVTISGIEVQLHKAQTVYDPAKDADRCLLTFQEGFLSDLMNFLHEWNIDYSIKHLDDITDTDLPIELDMSCQNDDDCTAGEFCAYSSCGADVGTCQLQPDACTLQYDPVCGCDGRTYSNDCSAAAAGQSVDYEGSCAEPVSTCTETDGGKDYYEAGVTEGTRYGSSQTRFEDNCATDTTLVEYYCSDDGVASVSYACPDGCSQGACIQDSDDIRIQVPTHFSLHEKQTAHVTNYQDMQITLLETFDREVLLSIRLPGGCGEDADPRCLGQPDYYQELELHTGEIEDVLGVKIGLIAVDSTAKLKIIFSESNEFDYSVRTDKKEYVPGDRVKIIGTLESQHNDAYVTANVKTPYGTVSQVDMARSSCSTSGCRDGDCEEEVVCTYVGYYLLHNDLPDRPVSSEPELKDTTTVTGKTVDSTEVVKISSAGIEAAPDRAPYYVISTAVVDGQKQSARTQFYVSEETSGEVYLKVDDSFTPGEEVTIAVVNNGDKDIHYYASCGADYRLQQYNNGEYVNVNVNNPCVACDLMAQRVIIEAGETHWLSPWDQTLFHNECNDNNDGYDAPAGRYRIQFGYVSGDREMSRSITADFSIKGTSCEWVCRNRGTNREGWYDSCTGDLIRYEKCSEGGSICNGCMDDNVCLPFGTRTVREGEATYCNIDGQFTDQKAEGATCQNNYECETNTCISGQCTDLSREIEETKGMLQRVLDWFARIFG